MKLPDSLPIKSEGATASRAPGTSESGPVLIPPQLFDFHSGLTEVEKLNIREAVKRKDSSTGDWATGSRTQEPKPQTTERLHQR